MAKELLTDTMTAAPQQTCLELLAGMLSQPETLAGDRAVQGAVKAVSALVSIMPASVTTRVGCQPLFKLHACKVILYLSPALDSWVLM